MQMQYRQQVAQNFSRASARYGLLSTLQAEIGAALIAQAEPHLQRDALIVDVGAGTGQVTKQWPARTIALDAAFGMCRQSRLLGLETVCAEAGALPLKNTSVDAVASNVMLQWISHPERFFAEAHRVLKPGGILAVSTFAHGTLAELAQAFAKAGEERRVSDFATPQALADAMENAGFAPMSQQIELKVEPYRDVLDLCFYLRDIGATNQRPDRPRGLLTARKLRAVAAHYPREGEGISASWAVARIVARKT